MSDEPISIEHITITTGAALRLLRSEVADEVVAQAHAWLADGGTVGDTGWRVAIVQAPAGSHVYDLIWQDETIVSCFLAVDRAGADRLWPDMQMMASPGMILQEPAGLPWLAVVLVAAPRWLLATPEAVRVIHEAGDLERVVAWALLDRSDWIGTRRGIA